MMLRIWGRGAQGGSWGLVGGVSLTFTARADAEAIAQRYRDKYQNQEFVVDALPPNSTQEKSNG